ncbi:MAG: hypothetical protein ABIS38_09970 [Sphingomicrobium sp.]
MVIRSIREHVVELNWLAVAIDLAIVVVGVFLGTQANNWNEARIERATAADYRVQIIDDLKENEADLQSRQNYYTLVRSHALAALAAIEAPARPRGPTFLIDAYQASQVWLRPMNRTGYDEMTSAGFTHSIGNRQTRSRLTNYYTQLRQFDVTAANTTTYRERVRRALPYDVQLAIRESCGERLKTLPSGAQFATFPEQCSPRLNPAVASLALSRLQAAELGDDLTRHIADLDQKLSGFDRYKRLAHDIRLFLEAQDRY